MYSLDQKDWIKRISKTNLVNRDDFRICRTKVWNLIENLIKVWNIGALLWHEISHCLQGSTNRIVAWVNFDIFSNHNLNVFYWNLNWITDIAVCGFPTNSREFPDRVTMSKPNEFVDHNKLTGWIQIIWIKLITYLYKSLQYNKEVCPSGISEQPQPGTVRPSQLRPSV